MQRHRQNSKKILCTCVCWITVPIILRLCAFHFSSPNHNKSNKFSADGLKARQFDGIKSGAGGGWRSAGMKTNMSGQKTKKKKKRTSLTIFVIHNFLVELEVGKKELVMWGRGKKDVSQDMREWQETWIYCCVITDESLCARQCAGLCSCNYMWGLKFQGQNSTKHQKRKKRGGRHTR